MQVHITELMCAYWQVLNFMECINMYCGCIGINGMYWHGNVVVCIGIYCFGYVFHISICICMY